MLVTVSKKALVRHERAGEGADPDRPARARAAAQRRPATGDRRGALGRRTRARRRRSRCRRRRRPSTSRSRSTARSSRTTSTRACSERRRLGAHGRLHLAAAAGRASRLADRAEPFRMLAEEAEHPAQVPERVPREEALVDHRRVVVARDRARARASAPSRPARRGRRRRCPRRSAGSRRPSRRAPRASARRISRQAPPSSQSPCTGSVGRCRSARPGARRGCAAAAAAYVARSCRARSESGAASAARFHPARARAGRRGRRFGCASANRTSSATAPSSGYASGFETTTYSPVVPVIPTLTLAANESGRSFSSTRTPSGTAPTLPGRFAITSRSSTCAAERRQRALELTGVAVRDDDRRDRHRPSTSR